MSSPSRSGQQGRASANTDVGDLIASTFDMAARYSDDPVEVAKLAVRVVMRLLRSDGYGPPPVRRQRPIARVTAVAPSN